MDSAPQHTDMTQEESTVMQLLMIPKVLDSAKLFIITDAD